MRRLTAMLGFVLLSCTANAEYPKPGYFRGCGVVRVDGPLENVGLHLYIPSGIDRPKHWRIGLTSKNADGTNSAETVEVFKSLEKAFERRGPVTACVEGRLYDGKPREQLLMTPWNLRPVPIAESKRLLQNLWD